MYSYISVLCMFVYTCVYLYSAALWLFRTFMSWPNSSRAAQLVMAQSGDFTASLRQNYWYTLSISIQSPSNAGLAFFHPFLPFYTFDTFTWLILPPKIAVDPAIGKNSKIRSSMKHVNVETAGLRADVKRIWRMLRKQSAAVAGPIRNVKCTRFICKEEYKRQNTKYQLQQTRCRIWRGGGITSARRTRL